MLTPETVTAAIGPLSAGKVARIIATGATAEEITAAHDWAKDGLATGLSARAREVHTILCADDELWSVGIDE